MSVKARTTAGVAGLAITGLVLTAVPGIVLSNAAWTDAEWTSATLAGDPGIGTLDCTAEGNFSTRGAGEFITADVLTLPNVATAGSLLVTNDGTDSTATPGATEVPPGSNKYYNVLDLALLGGAVQLGIPTLTIPLNTDLGVMGQYGEAQSDGYSAGASGLITESGGLVELDGYPEEDLPRSGSLSLGNIVDEVDPDAGPLAGSVTDLGLELGAVGAAAAFDACDADWAGTLEGFLTREYLIAGLDLGIESPLVGDLTGLIQQTVDDLTALVADPDDEIAAVVLDQLDLAGLLTASVSASVSASVDVTGLTDLLGATYADSDGIVAINLADGTITLDLASLLGGPDGLNGLAPNTELLVNADVINALNAAVLEALADLVADVNAGIAQVAASLTVNGTVDITLTTLALVDLAEIHIPLSGTPTITVLDLGLCAIPVLPVCTVLATITGQVAGLGDVTSILTGLVTDLTGQLVTDLGALAVATAPIVEMLELVLGELFGVGGLVGLVVNAQNDPQPANANPVPPDLDVLPSGQYDVSALYIGVLLDSVEVFLGRASVGVNTALP